MLEPSLKTFDRHLLVESQNCILYKAQVYLIVLWTLNLKIHLFAKILTEHLLCAGICLVMGSSLICLSWPPRGEGNGTPLQSSCLENPMDGGAWKAAVHGVTNSWTRLSDFTFTFHFHALEKEMATHSSVLTWRTPGVGEPGGLPSMGSNRVGHDWSDLAADLQELKVYSFTNNV